MSDGCLANLDELRAHGWLEAARAADELERLRAFTDSIGLCTCKPYMCAASGDLQCRARQARTGIDNSADEYRFEMPKSTSSQEAK